uniref:ShTK domain protein n=1 Tax=Haemonchus contortus TaxID=6289 RepID=A0A7I4Y2Q9_HAECO
LEIALRQYDPTVSLPYWDSTPDARLDDPTASVLWDDELMGSADSSGTLSSGLFAYWQAHLDHPTQRFLGRAQNSRLTTQETLNNVNQQNRANQILAFSAASNSCPRDQFPPRDAVEFIHGSNHVWIGGDMRVTTQATNDPIFFLHHCMIDNIWETWRLSRQTRAQRQNDYPTDNIYCSSQSHFARSIMVPFSPIVNIDGLSNDYTDNLYSYAPRPSCSSSNRDCGSRYLFCHGTQFVCVSRIRAPFACDPARYGGVDPCYGRCVNRRCVAPPRAAAGPPLAGAPPQEVPIEQDESCYNQNPCCATWANRGGCTQDPARTKIICAASCGACTPQNPITDDCTDRHPLCSDFASAGRCTSSVNFMAENCRRTCNLCGTPRSAGCATRRLF